MTNIIAGSLGILCCFYQAFVIKFLWNDLIVSHFTSLPEINMLASLGIVLMVSLLRYSPPRTQQQVDDSENLVSLQVVLEYIITTIVLVVAVIGQILF